MEVLREVEKKDDGLRAWCRMHKCARIYEGAFGQDVTAGPF